MQNSLITELIIYLIYSIFKCYISIINYTLYNFIMCYIDFWCERSSVDDGWHIRVQWRETVYEVRSRTNDAPWCGEGEKSCRQMNQSLRNNNNSLTKNKINMKKQYISKYNRVELSILYIFFKIFICKTVCNYLLRLVS